MTATWSRPPWDILQPTPGRYHFLVTGDAAGTTSEDTDPTTGTCVAIVPQSTEADVAAAVAMAKRAFLLRGWRNDGALRARVLSDFARGLRANVDRLAVILSREQGKTLAEACSEITGSADMVEYYAGLARALYGRSAVLGDDVHGVILREPIGVVGVITPWNWPLTLLVRSLAPALAAGNTCVVKPASLTPAITVEALQILAAHEELPDGVLTCVLGPGSVVGDALVGNQDVDMIAFTGESGTGVSVMQRAATDLRKVALELGGKSPNLVFADAHMDKAIDGALNAIFTTTGQICTAGSRLLVEDSIYEQFMHRIAERVEVLVLGDPLDPRVGIGPVVSAGQKRTVEQFIDIGRHEGRAVCEAALPDDPSCRDGSFVAPIVFADLPGSSRLVREEIFGPVLVADSFSSEEEAIVKAEDTEFGLAAGLWTTDLDRAWRVGRALRSGTIWINTYHHFYAEAEVGGFRHSGLGRQQGVEGLYEFTETKHMNFDAGASLW